MKRKSTNRIIKPLDYLVFLVAIGVVVGFSLYSIDQSGPGASVEVQTDDGLFLYSLAQDSTHDFSGPIGQSAIEIVDGKVRFVYSPCRDQICVAAGHLDASGQWAACLPNRIFVTVVGNTQGTDGVDATAF